MPEQTHAFVNNNNDNNNNNNNNNNKLLKATKALNQI